jgi:alginate O-acetyltransferase complex protein AlgI
MFFNSLEFIVFFLIVFSLYWFVFPKDFKKQNILLLGSSYFFYGYWDARFLFLLAFSTLLDYVIGQKIYVSDAKNRKFLLWISVVINLGFLGFFKYFNFFTESFIILLNKFGLQAHAPSLKIILPIGISFYTLHGLSYVFDLYNKKIEPAKNLVNYALFVSFFPLLVAGPIERATHLLPQVEKPRFFDYLRATDGLKQILWGLFKKLVIADNCAGFANQIFNNASNYSGSTLVLGAVFFSFQIYGDFSGYSDMALGTARLLGFDLIRNFNFPYFAESVSEFWRRWHISLSSWLRDYLYLPLGGSRFGTLNTIKNTFIVFGISGLWHGANWTYVVWGLLNAVYLVPSILLENEKKVIKTLENPLFLKIKHTFKVLMTFSLVTISWIFFRADSLTKAFQYIGNMFSKSLFQMPRVFPKIVILLLIFFIIIEFLGRHQPYAIAQLGSKMPRFVRWFCYAFLLFLIGMYMQTEKITFIYFQF